MARFVQFLLWTFIISLFVVPIYAQEESTTYEIALQRIEKAAKERYARLDLSNLGLTELPPEIWQLAHLEFLYLEDNQLTSLAPEIGQLQSLVYIDLSNNNLKTLPVELSQIAGLADYRPYWLAPDASMPRTLALEANPELDIPSWVIEQGTLAILAYLRNPDAIIPLNTEEFSPHQIAEARIEQARIISVPALDLSNLELDSVPYQIGELAQLKVLNLAENQLATLPPEIGQLRQLEFLILDHNQLTALPPEIGQLKQLQSLQAQKNLLDSLPPEIGNLSQLTQLRLDDNRLSSLPPEIGNLTRLTQLNMNHNLLTSLAPEIGRLSQLQDLHLHTNQLSSLPDGLGELRWLRVLDLSDNQLSSLPIGLGNLQWLRPYFTSEIVFYPPIEDYVGNCNGCMSSYFSIDENPLESLPAEIVSQGGEVVLDYLQAEHDRIKSEQKRLILASAAAVGLLALFILGFRIKQGAHSNTKKKH